MLMMSNLRISNSRIPYVLASITLWGLVGLGISPGQSEQIMNPSNLFGFINGLRSISPFAAGLVALMIIVYKVGYLRDRNFDLFSPLGLAVSYGVVGLLATVISPDKSVAIRWVLLYLSAPIVLWGIISCTTDSLSSIKIILNLTQKNQAE